MRSELVEKFGKYLTSSEVEEMYLIHLSAEDGNVNAMGIARLEELIEKAKTRARLLVV
jgi:hypothetical protein